MLKKQMELEAVNNELNHSMDTLKIKMKSSYLLINEHEEIMNQEIEKIELEFE